MTDTQSEKNEPEKNGQENGGIQASTLSELERTLSPYNHRLEILWLKDGRTQITLEGIDGFRQIELDTATRLASRVMRGARGHARATGEQKYVHVR